MVVHGAPLALAKPVGCDHVFSSVSVGDELRHTRPASWSSAKEALQRRRKYPILLDQMDADAANSARLKVTTPRCWSQHQCERIFHARGGSLQDAPLWWRGPREPRLVVETPRPVEEQTASQEPQTPNCPARCAQMIIPVEIGSA
jgi:hypothetical protein